VSTTNKVAFGLALKAGGSARQSFKRQYVAGQL